MAREDVTAQLQNAVAVLQEAIESAEYELTTQGMDVLAARDVQGRFLMLDAYTARVNALAALAGGSA